MAEFTTKIDLVGLPAVKTLIELLDEYQSELPPVLQKQLQLVAESEVFEIDIEWLGNNGYIRPCEVYTDGVEVPHSININPILRRVTRLGGSPVFFNKCTVVDAHGRTLHIPFKGNANANN